MKLIHASAQKVEKITANNKRSGSYFFDYNVEPYFPFEDFSNIISKEECEKKEEKDLYSHIAFFYGDFLHVVDVNLNNTLDITDYDIFSNILLDIGADEDDIDEIIDTYYDTEYEKKVNLYARKNGYDSIKMKDSTEGINHISYVLFDDILIKE